MVLRPPEAGAPAAPATSASGAAVAFRMAVWQQEASGASTAATTTTASRQASEGLLLIPSANAYDNRI